MAIFKKGISKREKINLVEDKGEFLEDYPTDSFGGSNTGDAELYCFKGKAFEVNKERDGNKVQFGQVSRRCGKRTESKKVSPKQISQQKKFKKATQICKKKKGNYRGCMKKELKK